VAGVLADESSSALSLLRHVKAIGSDFKTRLGKRRSPGRVRPREGVPTKAFRPRLPVDEMAREGHLQNDHTLLGEKKKPGANRA
jgi:hypothetical protein